MEEHKIVNTWLVCDKNLKKKKKEKGDKKKDKKIMSQYKRYMPLKDLIFLWFWVMWLIPIKKILNLMAKRFYL